MLKTYTPTSAGRRHRLDVSNSDITSSTPEKTLLAKGLIKRNGRNNTGRITVRHRGGGVAHKLRIIDFKRNKPGVTGIVATIEYDPARTARIALVQYSDGEKRYILAPVGLAVGQTIMSGAEAPVQLGNAMPLSKIPVGMPIHNIELRPGKGGQMIRSAGSNATVQSKEGNFVTIAMPSKEVRLIHADCMATIGQLGNVEWKTAQYGKAGRKRLKGIRPTVRGTAQHPDSHPHGGGEGRSPVGMKYPKTPWGKHAHGTKTRNKKKYSTKMIVRDRRVK